MALLAEERGCTPLDVMLDVSLDDDLETAVLVGAGQRRPRGDRLVAAAGQRAPRPGGLGAHVSQLCDACFSTDLLGNWVRGRGVMPLERAIHKLTGEPAGVYGLADRGTVAVGKAADLCVFDPETVDPGPLRARHDFPADGERLTADAPVSPQISIDHRVKPGGDEEMASLFDTRARNGVERDEDRYACASASCGAVAGALSDCAGSSAASTACSTRSSQTNSISLRAISGMSS